jgi:hypothetical protein
MTIGEYREQTAAGSPPSSTENAANLLLAVLADVRRETTGGELVTPFSGPKSRGVAHQGGSGEDEPFPVPQSPEALGAGLRDA